MSQELRDFSDLADVRAKYGPVMHGELHVDLESGHITGDGLMLAFWESLVDYFRATIRGLEAENAHWKDAVARANSMLRSTWSIAERNGELVNWTTFRRQLGEVLDEQHRMMYPEQHAEAPR